MLSVGEDCATPVGYIPVYCTHTITHSAGANSTGHVQIPGESYQVKPSQRWVGYGNPYQYPQIPSYQQGPGLGVRRFAPNHTYSPYPMPPSYASTPQPHPFPEPPSTPSHHHDTGAAVTSPVVPSPRPTNTNSLHFYHPANAGLYTLCQAAMMTSSNPDAESYSSYQPPPLDEQSSSLGSAHPSRPPPPSVHYYPAALPFSSDPLQPQTSPVSPHPPNYPVQLDQTQTHIPPEPHTLASWSSRRPKRTRTAFTLAQQDKLELAYHSNPYPDSFYRQKVALDIGVPEDRIQVCIVCSKCLRIKSCVYTHL